MRLKSRSNISASVLIKSVLARPGTPTSKQWPLANRAIKTSSMTWSWPTITLRISPSMVSRLTAKSSISAISCCCISVASMGVLFAKLVRGDEPVEGGFGEPSLLSLTERRVGVGQQTVDKRVERIDLDRFLEGGAALLEILGHKIGAAQLHVGVGVVRVDVQGFLEQGQGLVGAIHGDH